MACRMLATVGDARVASALAREGCEECPSSGVESDWEQADEGEPAGVASSDRAGRVAREAGDGRAVEPADGDADTVVVAGLAGI